jgi:hypothetical protein
VQVFSCIGMDLQAYRTGEQHRLLPRPPALHPARRIGHADRKTAVPIATLKPITGVVWH